MKIRVIYEDNHILIVEKPVNIPTQEDASMDPDMLTLLKDDLKERYQKPGNVFLGLVHRLDRPTGGVMIFAKTSKAASRLSEQVRDGRLEKIYMAVVHGNLEGRSEKLTHTLLKDAKTNTVHAVDCNKPGGKLSTLEYRTLSYKDGLSLVRIKLHTGRSHQIRVQFSTEGYPLYGDQKYGADRNKPGQQLALWACRIGFEHPVTHGSLTFDCYPPGTFPWDRFEEPISEEPLRPR